MVSRANVITRKAFKLITYAFLILGFCLGFPVLGKYVDTILPNYQVLSPKLIILGLGIVTIMFGAVLVFWSIFLFETRGRGTPNPLMPPRDLVISGPYRISRNPMYTGGFLVILGQSLIYNSLGLVLVSLIFIIVINFHLILFEEPELKKRFGAQYEDYTKKVSRFFNPFKLLKGDGLGNSK
jgi:protein-S-isoprenylcysteine O-methyltransferase Ste14